MRYSIILLFLIYLSACKSAQTVTTHTHKDTTITRYKDSTIFTKEEKTIGTINIDSLSKLYKNPLTRNTVINHYITIKDTSHRAEIKEWIDSTGKLVQQLHLYADSIKIQNKETLRTITDNTKQVITYKKTFWQKLEGIFPYIVIVLLLLLMLFKK